MELSCLCVVIAAAMAMFNQLRRHRNVRPGGRLPNQETTIYVYVRGFIHRDRTSKCTAKRLILSRRRPRPLGTWLIPNEPIVLRFCINRFTYELLMHDYAFRLSLTLLWGKYRGAGSLHPAPLAFSSIHAFSTSEFRVRVASARPLRSKIVTKALDLDWSDPDTLIGAAGAVLGLLVGLGAPILYIKASGKLKSCSIPR